MSVDKTTIYYVIVATFLLNFAFIPLLFEVLQQKNMSNIPYLTLIYINFSYNITIYSTL